MDGVVGAFSLIVFFLVARESLRVKSHAKTFMRLTSIGMLFAAGFCLAHYLEGATFGPAAIILMNLAIRFVSDGIAVALYNLLKSFWKMAGKGKGFKKAVVVCQVLEFVALSAASVPMIVLIDDDFGFTLSMTVFFALFTFHFAGLLVFLLLSTSSVINTVRQATGAVAAERRTSSWESFGLASRPSNLGASERTSTLGTANLSPKSEASTGSFRRNAQGKNLLIKVQKYRNYGKHVGPVVIIAIWIILILEWSLGSVPLLWAGYAICILHFPLIGLVQLLLGKSKEQQLETSSSKQLLLTSSPSPSAAKGAGSSVVF